MDEDAPPDDNSLPKKRKRVSRSSGIELILRAQEDALRRQVEVVQLTGKGELIGAELEVEVRRLLGLYLPPSLRIEAGFVASITGRISAHFDCILFDREYPVLAVINNSVIVPLEAVLAIVEFKTTLSSEAIDDVIKKSQQVSDIMEWELHNAVPDTADLAFYAFALRATLSNQLIKDKLASADFSGHLLVAEPAESRGRSKSPSFSFGPNEASGKHFYLEGTSESRTPVDRSTDYVFGFLLYKLRSFALTELYHRNKGAPGREQVLDDYLKDVIDVFDSDKAIRVATEDDKKEIESIASRAFAEQVRILRYPPAGMIQSFDDDLSAGRVKLLEWNATTKAFFIVEFDGGVLNIKNIAVDYPVQGKGYGKRILHYIAALAKDQGASAIRVELDSRLIKVIERFVSCKFVKICERVHDGCNNSVLERAVVR